MRRALIIALVVVFTSHGFAALFGRITDPIHGFSVDLPRGWTVRASVNLGKILIASGDSTKIVSIFVMKGKPKEVLRLLTFMVRSGVMYREEKDALVAKCSTTYMGAIPFVDGATATDLGFYGLINRPVDLTITIFPGRKYNVVMAVIVPQGEEAEDVRQVVTSFQFVKPTVKAETVTIRDWDGTPAFYIDLPKGWKLDARILRMPKSVMGMPYIKISSDRGRVTYMPFNYTFMSYADPMMPFAIATVFDPDLGQEVQCQGAYQDPSQFILGWIAPKMNLHLNPDAIESFDLPEPEGFQATYGMGGVSVDFGIYHASGGRCELEVLMAKTTASMPPGVSYGMTGNAVGIEGDEEARAVAAAAIRSLVPDPKWLRANLRAEMQEIKREMEHRRWMWNEFRKTQRYISQLHQDSMAQERKFQEEMARAFANVLSDQIYVRDPESGEVFHIDDVAQQYWTNEFGDIIGVDEPVDEWKLEAMGWHKMEARLEGFGSW